MQVAENTKLPPMLAQYLEFKRAYPECMLFFQVGDFFEVFFEDAQIVATNLNLTLTARDKQNPNPVPMCGVPVAAIDGYLDRLVSRGLSAAVVVQFETKSGGKSVIERRLERIVTPAIRLLGATDHRDAEPSVAAVFWTGRGEFALVSCRATGSELRVLEHLTSPALAQELAMLAPAEIVVPNTVEHHAVDRRLGIVRDLERAARSAQLKFRSPKDDFTNSGARALGATPGFTSLDPLSKRACRLLVDYIEEVTVQRTVHFERVVTGGTEDTVRIDAVTRRNLELVHNARDGSERGTLFGFLDRTASIAGRRMLREWLLAPLATAGPIIDRQELVRAFVSQPAAREEIQSLLRGTPDLARIAARVELGVLSPKEAGALRDVLERLPRLAAAFEAASMDAAESELRAELGRLGGLCADAASLLAGLAGNPPYTVMEGGIFSRGYNAELDEILMLVEEGSSWIATFEQSERARTGIASLKVKNNNLIGYFIELTQTNASRAPADYIKKQSTVSCERFTTPELRQREEQALHADERRITLERALFETLRESLRASIGEIRALGGLLGSLDVLAALAEVAEHERFAFPALDDTTELEIVGGCHPVIRKILGGDFIPNDLILDDSEQRCIVLTGPNMGGKSTYLRQAALIAVMAQIGSAVPARSARIGIVDRIFARIGASDDIHEGDSTFMIEMREAATILQSATNRSLVLIDEIGRGTTTSDGLALAQAILEYLASATGARTLFATHFHELTALEEGLRGIRNFRVGSEETDSEVVFTHHIEPGAAARSYGLEVARRAGLPSSVTDRAQHLLDTQETREEGLQPARTRAPKALRQVSLFQPAASTAKVAEAKPHPVLAKLTGAPLDDLTPRQALDLLYALQAEARSPRHE